MSSPVNSLALNTPIIKIATRGKAKARKNLKRSILRASIIIIEGPMFSVLLSILKKLSEKSITMSERIS